MRPALRRFLPVLALPILVLPILVLATAISLASSLALAQPAPPEAAAAPADRPYPGTIRLSVDATDLDRHIFRVHEQVPIQGDQPVTLFYPQWPPGDHKPSGPIAALAGLVVQAGGQPVAWRRDPLDPYAFHLRPPAGATSLELEFQYLSPVAADEGRIVMTPEMLSLQWNAVLLYPAGYYVRRIPVQADLLLPRDWRFGSALETQGPPTTSPEGERIAFAAAPLDVLVDSPVLAGRYFERLDLDPGAAAPVRLDVAADYPELLDIAPSQLTAHRLLVRQAYRLFGDVHYDHYDFLLSLTNRLGEVGLEHHRSSENVRSQGYFLSWDLTAAGRDLLPHEFTHAWNGKFRRPADLWTSDYNTPMQGSLLWVYEGQTEYWGFVLAARSGLWSRGQALDAIAMTAATIDQTPGRAWKDLQETTNDSVVAMRRPQPWRSWQRSEDYYREGLLLWLDADTLIRQRSGGRRSLDDFAKAFFGVDGGGQAELTYDFDAVVKTLNAVQPYDWATFLRARLDGHGPGAPLDGISRGGYALSYAQTPSEFQQLDMAARHVEDLTFSLGLAVRRDQVLESVLWGGPAFRAGLTAGIKLLAVNGVAYDPERLKMAITAAKAGTAPIELLIQAGDHFRTVRIDYHDGLRYPRLEPDGRSPASLDAILTPKG